MKLFENLQVGRMSLANRIVYPALVDRLAGDDGFTTPELVERVMRIARGGVGLFILQAAGVANQKSGQLLRISDDKYIEGLKQLTDRVHSETQAKIGIQLIHFLKISRSGYRQMVEDLSHDEIQEIVADFGDAALRAVEAGFDCIEIHCAHAYTLSSFLSLRNKRQDEYGKTIEGRLRIVEEVTRQVREKVGDRITLGVRLNGDEFILAGNTLSQSRIIARRFAELGYEYISVSAGGKFEDGLVEKGMTSPYSGYSGSRTMPKKYMPDGVNVYLAGDIKKAILPHQVPIITAGKIPSPELAESILQAGAADLIGLARPLLCDPEWPEKARNGKFDEIVYCKYCGLCNVDDANFVPVVCHQWPKGSIQAPDPGQVQVHKTVCMLCFMVCGINAHVQGGKLIKVEGTPENPLNCGLLCPKGQNLPDYVYSPDRIKYPMKKVDGSWQRISWDEALDTITEKLQNIKLQYGARALAVSVGSIGAENIEISAFAQRFRGAFGTPNFFSIEAHCFRSRIMARLMTFGTYPLEDPEKAECIVLWGHNPDASEPPLAAKITKRLGHGLKLIVIDPKKIPMAHQGLYAQIIPGTDCALALGLMNVIINEGLHNRGFVEKYTLGFAELTEHVKNYPPEKVAEITGIPAAKIKSVARIFASAKSASIIQGINTLDQHINGFQNNRVLAILQAITGNYNIPGGWAINPMMRLTDLRINVEEDPIGAEEHPLFRKFWGKASPYGQQMLLPDVILTEKPYPIKALITSGGNPALSWPDTKKVREAFSKLDLVVVMDLFMTETAELADIVLPACSSLEKLGLAYNYALTAGIPYAMLSRKIIEPIGESWPDWKFYSELGRRMGYGEYFPWNSDEEVVENFLKSSQVTYEQLQENPSGLWYGERCYDMTAAGQIKTPSGKIELYSKTLADAGYDPIPAYLEPTQSAAVNPGLAKKYPLMVATGARIVEYTHYQMRNVASLNQMAPYPMAEINPATAEEYDVADGEVVLIETRNGQVKLQLKVTEDLAPRVVNILHGWGRDASANLLAALDVRDPVTGYPELRALAGRIKKIIGQKSAL